MPRILHALSSTRLRVRPVRGLTAVIVGLHVGRSDRYRPGGIPATSIGPNPTLPEPEKQTDSHRAGGGGQRLARGHEADAREAAPR